jgi:hypothetical protein
MVASDDTAQTYSSSPTGGGQGGGQIELGRALAVPRPPYTELQTAISDVYRPVT